MTFIKDFVLEPSSVDKGKIGEYIFERSLSSIDGLAYLNFNEVSGFETIGRFLKSKSKKLGMNYRKRNGIKTFIGFRFKDAPLSANLIQEIITASPVIDYLVIPPSNREKVTVPKDEDCIFIDVKTNVNSSSISLSDKQKWVYYKNKDLNLFTAKINLNWEYSISFEVPSTNYKPIIAPCGRELPRITEELGFGLGLTFYCIEYCGDVNGCIPFKEYDDQMQKMADIATKPAKELEP